MTQTMQVRSERAPFVMLPRWLLYHPEVDAGAKLLYCLLHDLVNGREGPTRPVTRAQLAEGLVTSVDTVDRRLAQLVAAGAVEKHAQVPSGGQVANVYQVWLTPPDGLRRLTPTDSDPHDAIALQTSPIPVDNRSRKDAAPVTAPLVDRSRGSAAPPQGCGPGHRTGAAPSVLKEEEEDQEVPPQPPRTAGGHNEPGDNDEGQATATAGRRAEGTNPRAKGAHPRAAEQVAAAEQERERAARAEADLEARTAARLAEDEAGAAARAAFEAEGLVVSAALDDDRLTRIVETVRSTLTGPLATSALTVTRAVINWCRTAAAQVGSAPLPEAVDAALAATPLFANPAEATAPPLPAAEVAPGTVPLRRRVAALLTAVTTEVF